MDMTLDVVRKEAESCDYVTGFQMIHALGGGTGSGMGSLLLEKLNDQYAKKIITTFTVFPSAKVRNIIKPISVFQIDR
jgi:tubulin beta